jgi:RNA polymerase sigma factor (sigma-70 family)
MAASEPIVETTDNELLMQFVRHRDERAFCQLVERHAPTVMSVCRQVSRDEQDAEDAFQATLLILAGRAGRLSHVSSLGGWLHQVAYRTAVRSGKRRANRREVHLGDEPELEQSDALQEIHCRELQQVMHQERQQIPSRYRNAIVLCYLQGQTRAQAAEHLDCSEAAVKAALAWGRRQLRFRLLKRGLVLSLALATASKAITATKTNLAPSLIDEAVILWFQRAAAGDPAATLSKSVQDLVRNGATMTASSTTKGLTAASIAAVLIAAPLVLLGQISSGPDRAINEPVGIGPLARQRCLDLRLERTDVPRGGRRHNERRREPKGTPSAVTR